MKFPSRSVEIAYRALNGHIRLARRFGPRRVEDDGHERIPCYVKAFRYGREVLSTFEGWSVSNSVSGSVGLDVGFIKDYLKTSLGINYSRTWTTATTDQYSTLVKNGNAGVWFTQP
ncbi:hypothetical protein CDEST_09022 [Colletotrichum destructivum]|uniref:Uncharacterized protein n=1 Tax=Colletotrichum destructivum TaxID=34406 RepID=A0AAX4IMK7_9PEZI|nr:hypothetical protein CDEST_09022 [Colletotrichum destructivum]